MKISISIAAPQTTSSGPRCLSGGSVTPSDPAGADDQHLAVLAQVAGEEDDDAELRELGRLEGDRADVDAEVGAVDLRTDHRQRAAAAAATRPTAARSGTGSARARGSPRKTIVATKRASPTTNQLRLIAGKASSIR